MRFILNLALNAGSILSNLVPTHLFQYVYCFHEIQKANLHLIGLDLGLRLSWDTVLDLLCYHRNMFVGKVKVIVFVFVESGRRESGQKDSSEGCKSAHWNRVFSSVIWTITTQSTARLVLIFVSN